MMYRLKLCHVIPYSCSDSAYVIGTLRYTRLSGPNIRYLVKQDNQ